VPGTVFLSGGLSEEVASVYLNLMNGIDREARWNVALSLMVVLFNTPACRHGGSGSNLEAGQSALLGPCSGKR